MKGFEFKAMPIPVTACGEKYRIAYDSQLEARMRNLLGACSQIGTAPEQEQVARLSEVVDTLLGDGAAARIFDGRTVNQPDLVELVLFIASAVIKENERRIRATAKRAQRLAEKQRNGV